MPTKLATAPMRGLPEMSMISVLTSKSSAWTATFMSASRHRRKKRDFVAGIDRRIRRGHVLVDGDAYHFHVGERLLPRAAALHEVQPQPGDRARRVGHVDHLGAGADQLAQVRKQEDFYFHQ